MNAISASVVVVSRHRPAELARCVAGLLQQDHPEFELIIVADPFGLAAVQKPDSQHGFKLVAFDEPNISAARNAGLAQAAGNVVAFVDDDAVAEPSWLSRLTAPFAQAEVVAATGFVLGRNGFSYQWQAAEVDNQGRDHPFLVPQEGEVRAGTATLAVKTQGCNCAFRRDDLNAIGGFDPAFRFFLDEADVNLRLAGFGKTAIVPTALVHHGYGASIRRRADRVPLSLFEIAASTAVFLRRHAKDVELEKAWQDLRQHQEARVAQHLVAGRLGTSEAAALQSGLRAGWQDGLARRLPALPALQSNSDFQPLTGTGPKEGLVIAGRIWQRKALLARAREGVARGLVVTVICLAPTPRAHRMEFTRDGYWLQEGGLFGWSARIGPRLRLSRFSRRVAEEVSRLAAFRPVD